MSSSSLTSISIGSLAQSSATNSPRSRNEEQLMRPASATFAILKPDVISEIATFLDTKDVFSLRRTNKEIDQALATTPPSQLQASRLTFLIEQKHSEMAKDDKCSYKGCITTLFLLFLTAIIGAILEYTVKDEYKNTKIQNYNFTSCADNFPIRARDFCRQTSDVPDFAAACTTLIQRSCTDNFAIAGVCGCMLLICCIILCRQIIIKKKAENSQEKLRQQLFSLLEEIRDRSIPAVVKKIISATQECQKIATSLPASKLKTLYNLLIAISNSIDTLLSNLEAIRRFVYKTYCTTNITQGYEAIAEWHKQLVNVKPLINDEKRVIAQLIIESIDESSIDIARRYLATTITRHKSIIDWFNEARNVRVDNHSDEQKNAEQPITELTSLTSARND